MTKNIAQKNSKLKFAVSLKTKQPNISQKAKSKKKRKCMIKIAEEKWRAKGTKTEFAQLNVVQQAKTFYD